MFQDNDVFHAVYNGKARHARVIKMLADDGCIQCEMLDDEGKPVQDPKNRYRSFTVAKLEQVELVNL